MTDAPALWRRDLADLVRTGLARCVAEHGDAHACLDEVAEQVEALVRERLADALEGEWRARIRTDTSPLIMRIMLDAAHWLRGGIVVEAIGSLDPQETTLRAVARHTRALAQLAPTVGRRVLGRVWATAGVN